MSNPPVREWSQENLKGGAPPLIEAPSERMVSTDLPVPGGHPRVFVGGGCSFSARRSGAKGFFCGSGPAADDYTVAGAEIPHRAQIDRARLAE